METQLSYFGFRYYNASLGRFINRDPLEERGGWNLYKYLKQDAADPYAGASGVQGTSWSTEWEQAQDRLLSNTSLPHTTQSVTFDGKRNSGLPGSSENNQKTYSANATGHYAQGGAEGRGPKTPSASVGNPAIGNANINLYIYAGNNPINGVDPMGLSIRSIWSWFLNLFSNTPKRSDKSMPTEVEVRAMHEHEAQIASERREQQVLADSEPGEVMVVGGNYFSQPAAAIDPTTRIGIDAGLDLTSALEDVDTINGIGQLGANGTKAVIMKSGRIAAAIDVVETISEETQDRATDVPSSTDAARSLVDSLDAVLRDFSNSLNEVKFYTRIDYKVCESGSLFSGKRWSEKTFSDYRAVGIGGSEGGATYNRGAQPTVEVLKISISEHLDNFTQKWGSARVHYK